MTDLVVVASEVAAVSYIDSSIVPLNEAVPVGGYGRVDTNGELMLGNATTAGELGNRRGIVVEILNQAARVMHDGVLDLGSALDALAIGDLVYVANTDGNLADVAGTVSQVAGVVIPGHAEETADKLLRLLLNP